MNSLVKMTSPLASDLGNPHTGTRPSKPPISPSGSVKRGPWSPEEDRKLMEIIALYGPTNWVRILSLLGSRSPKQCRERYHQNLKPLLNRNPITFEEGLLIEQLVDKHGKKWAEIARHLTGRSDNAIKNWWNGGANRRRRASHAVPSTTSDTLQGSPTKATQDSLVAPVAQFPSISQTAHTALGVLGNGGTQLPILPLPSMGLQLPGQPVFGGHRNSHVSLQTPPDGPSRHNSVVAGTPYTKVLAYPKLPHLPQILFNTSIFNAEEKAAAPFVLSKHTKAPSRLASLDHPSLPSIQTLKPRIGDDRRHSVTLGPLSSTSPALYMHLNASASLLYNSGNSSDHYDLPGLLASRHNSVSYQDFYSHRQFAIPVLAALSSHNLRRPSVAHDLFPNPLAGHIQGELSHKRNHSLNLFSPSITPISSSRLLVSSGSGDAAIAASTLNKQGIPPFKNILKRIGGEDEESVGKEGVDRIKVSRLID